MNGSAIQSAVGRNKKAPEDKKYGRSVTLSYKALKGLEGIAHRFGGEISPAIDIAVLWYLEDLKRDPSRLNPPTPQEQDK